MQSKTCFRCKQDHPKTSFTKNSRRSDGLDSYCPTCRKEKKAEWYSKNKDHVASYTRDYYYSHPEFRQQRSVYASDREKQIRHLPEFKAKKNSREAKRRSAKLQATPTWLTKEHFDEIDQIYWLAQDLKAVSGQNYHVDHIIPLQGESVCGLHVPWNLQVLPSEINISKSNKVKGAS